MQREPPPETRSYPAPVAFLRNVPPPDQMYTGNAKGKEEEGNGERERKKKKGKKESEGKMRQRVMRGDSHRLLLCIISTWKKGGSHGVLKEDGEGEGKNGGGEVVEKYGRGKRMEEKERRRR